MSQGKLGEKLGVSFQQVQKYENGKNRISASTLFLVSQVLGVDFSYFIEGYDQVKLLKEKNGLSYDLESGGSKLLLDYFFKIKNRALRTFVVDLVKNAASLPVK